MVFGITLTPGGWLTAIVVALLLLLAPMFAIGYIADLFPSPINAIINVIGGFLLMPVLLSLWYRRQYKTTGRGSAVFWVYCALYIGLFAVFVGKATRVGWNMDSAIGIPATGIAAVAMIYFAWKTQNQFALHKQ